MGSPPPNHLRFSEFIAPRVRARSQAGVEWRIVTIVRDPIARQLSDIYQNPEVVGEEEGGVPEAGRVLEYLTAYFRDFDESTDFVCRWFKREFVDFFRFPVYDRPFPSKRRHEIFEGGNVRGLVLRLEDFPSVIDDGVALGEWLGKAIPAKISARNTARDRASFESYDTVKKHLKIPRADLEKVYATAFARHFYADMREDLISRWSGE